MMFCLMLDRCLMLMLMLRRYVDDVDVDVDGWSVNSQMVQPIESMVQSPMPM